MPRPLGRVRRLRALCVLATLLALAAARPAAAQAPAVEAPAWTLLVDERPAPWPGRADAPLDSLGARVRAALEALHEAGHLLARVDTLVVDTLAAPPAVTLRLARGPAVRVGRVDVDGAVVLPDAADVLDLRPGDRFEPARLRRDVDALLARLDAAGYGLAAVHLDTLGLRWTEDGPVVDVRLRVDAGRALRIEGVALPEGARTRPAYAARLAGLAPGARLADYDAEAVQRRLRASGLFRRVGPPRLVARGDTSAVVELDVDEGPPGAFDLVVGYQPESGGGGGFVGNGHLVLRNLFGGGRRLALRLDQLPGAVSSFEAEARDPYVLGRPFALGAAFEGIQQDSTFTRQRYAVELGYHLAAGLEVFGTLSSEATRPGLAGTRVVGGRQRVARSDAVFTGVGLRYTSVDAPLAPRRGLLVEVSVESGRTSRSMRVDTTRVRTRTGLERLEGTARVFVPTFRRQTLVAGADAAALSSTAYDVADLFRFGGATSLRGYDEDAFRGRLVARALGEYRYALDATSYAYLFMDVGYVDRPDLGEVPALRRVLPGYGGGLVFATALGLVNASYGLSRQGGRLGGRVHVGLSVGL